jgi:hypothetical protein
MQLAPLTFVSCWVYNAQNSDLEVCPRGPLAGFVLRERPGGCCYRPARVGRFFVGRMSDQLASSGLGRKSRNAEDDNFYLYPLAMIAQPEALLGCSGARTLIDGVLLTQ